MAYDAQNFCNWVDADISYDDPIQVSGRWFSGVDGGYHINHGLAYTDASVPATFQMTGGRIVVFANNVCAGETIEISELVNDQISLPNGLLAMPCWAIKTTKQSVEIHHTQIGFTPNGFFSENTQPWLENIHFTDATSYGQGKWCSFRAVVSFDGESYTSLNNTLQVTVMLGCES
jgi:hypothetical protein